MAAGTRDRWNLFVCSFTILFVELVCIRWIPAYIRYLGYFTNFVLLGAFLGIGLGILQARRRLDLLTFFPLALAVLVGVVSTFKLQLTINSSQEVFFQDLAVKVHGTESFFLLPLVFGVVTLLFTLLGQNLGRLLAAVRPPLTAYTIDVAGSIAGSLLFALVSFLGSPPGVWFALGALGVLALPQRGGLVRVLNAGILLGVVVGVSMLGRSSSWSPYYRIDVQPRQGGGFGLFVNNIGHQDMVPYAFNVRHSFYYIVPFRTFRFPPSTRELIVGAGSGNDANVAVHNGIRHITAVEIDPTIYDLGRRLHPDHIYQQPGVHVVIDDGRAFLERTQGTYDLIVFALPDSLALTSSFANLRLESYLFTREAFAAARRHLSPNGVLVLYNYYRQPWVMQKIAGMLTEAFGGQVPYGRIYNYHVLAATLMDGPGLRMLPPALYAAHRITGAPGVDSATDDWPFLYLQTHSVPTIYLQAVALVWLLATFGVLLSLGRRGLRRFDAALFFTGLAFLLLEAKSIVNFTLLFGATWLVNALVIVGILATVLLANWVNAATRLRLDLRLLYLGLGGAVALNLLLPFEDLLVPNLALRYVLGCAVLFSPILLANLIFGRLFGETVTPDVAFASNLLGAFVGGTLEYLSLQIGYHLLLLPVAAAYALSWVAVSLRRGRAVDVATAAAAR
jgi:hypothetical protein